VAARRVALRGRSRDRTGLIWCATATDDSGLALSETNSVVFAPVVVDGDINLGAGQAHCTLLRIRGWVHVVENNSNTAGQRIVAAIAYVLDDSETGLPPSPFGVAAYTREDVLWTGGAGYERRTGTATEVDHGIHFDIDIKSKRRLRSGQTVVLAFYYNGPSLTEVTLFGALRALVKLR